MVTLAGTIRRWPQRGIPSWWIALLVFAALCGEALAQGVNDRYYRFEEGAVGSVASGTGSIVDSIWNAPDGTPSGGPIYSGDVPLPVKNRSPTRADR